ncbi:hypothetical protein VP01_6513g1 [Puccinia sorghi]|uniref:Uncharacterized protein n=1 Tax=Puccinia sorghi TaxID=27349 RepID=A0A0L6UHN4_9BASI|nr:hypothetical protein VP01_6513g1 [Puccinia sorghi]
MMNDNGINHRDAKGMYTSPLLLVPFCISLTDNLHSITGITQKISNLQSSCNSACDWKQNTGAGILDSDMFNGVNRYIKPMPYVDIDILDPIMGSRSVAKPLFMRSSLLNQQTKELPNLT